MNREYLGLCERWWRGWLAGELNPSPAIRRRFDVSAIPEPYLVFGDMQDPLTVLTTNPGGTMDHQRREAVQEGRSPIRSDMTYAEVARAMAEWYQRHLTRDAATRIRVQMALAEAAGFSGVIQLECCPWHSKDMRNKAKVLRIMRADDELSQYMRTLGSQLVTGPAVGLSAVSSRADLTTYDPRRSDWLGWQINLLGVDVDDTTRIPLTEGRTGISSVAICEIADVPRAMVLMKGGNRFPSRENLAPLVEWLRSAWTSRC